MKRSNEVTENEKPEQDRPRQREAEDNVSSPREDTRTAEASNREAGEAERRMARRREGEDSLSAPREDSAASRSAEAQTRDVHDPEKHRPQRREAEDTIPPPREDVARSSAREHSATTRPTEDPARKAAPEATTHDPKAKKDYLTGEEFRDLPRTGTIDPDRVRFSQAKCSSTFRDGREVSQLSDDLKSGKADASSVPAIRLVEKDDSAYTLDNRRLKSFQDAEVPVRYEKLDHIPKRELYKFDTENAGTDITVRGKN